MSELADFLTPTLARQLEAEQALINGDPGPRLAMTSIQDPVTVFGAKVPLKRGWDEVSEALRRLASRWSNGPDHRFDLVAAGVSGDLAYMVGFEHIANSVVGVGWDRKIARLDGERSSAVPALNATVDEADTPPPARPAIGIEIAHCWRHPLSPATGVATRGILDWHPSPCCPLARAPELVRIPHDRPSRPLNDRN